MIRSFGRSFVQSVSQLFVQFNFDLRKGFVKWFLQYTYLIQGMPLLEISSLVLLSISLTFSLFLSLSLSHSPPPPSRSMSLSPSCIITGITELSQESTNLPSVIIYMCLINEDKSVMGIRQYWPMSPFTRWINADLVILNSIRNVEVSYGGWMRIIREYVTYLTELDIGNKS